MINPKGEVEGVLENREGILEVSIDVKKIREFREKFPVWKDPDEFKPERFLQPLPERSADAYFPFGAGPRMCIGMGFAMAEMVLVISALVHCYQITTTTEKAGFEPLITLKPVGLYLQFHPR